MNTHRTLGWLLITFAGLLVWSQTIFVLSSANASPELSGFASRYTIVSSIKSYGLSLVVLVIAVALMRNASRAIAWTALAVTLLSLWAMVISELWLHYFVLPHQIASFAQHAPTYFDGSLWSLAPRILWHVILPLATVVSIFHLVASTRKDTGQPTASR